MRRRPYLSSSTYMFMLSRASVEQVRRPRPAVAFAVPRPRGVSPAANGRFCFAVRLESIPLSPCLFNCVRVRLRVPLFHYAYWTCLCLRMSHIPTALVREKIEYVNAYNVRSFSQAYNYTSFIACESTRSYINPNTYISLHAFPH